MKGSSLRRLGVTLLTILVVAATPALPARAAGTGAVAGHLTFSDGRPAAGGYVSVYRSSDYEWLGEDDTDGAGSYEITGLPEGSYKVRFSAITTQWAYQRHSFDTADAVTVTAGQVTTVDDVLLSPGTIAGRLIDSNGEPVPDAEVNANSVDGSSYAYGRTDTDGRYAIEVGPADYQIQFRVDGGEQWAYGRDSQADAAVFTLPAGGTVVVDETLRPTGSLAGSVTDATGQPVPGAFVTLYRDQLYAGQAYTDESGRYGFTRVFAGRYAVQVTGPDGGSQWAHQKPSMETADLFDVTAGAQITVDETLIGTGSVAGRLVRADGSGVPDAQVALDYEYSWLGSTQTDAFGNYRIDGVSAGDGYTVWFYDGSTGQQQYAHGKLDHESADRIAVALGKVTVVDDTMLSGGELRVRATDAATGAAVTDFCVDASGVGWKSACTAGDEAVLSGLPAGDYSVEVTPRGDGLYMRGQARATVTEGGTTSVSVPLALGGVITTTVLDRATGRPVADVCLSAHTAEQGMLGGGAGGCSDGEGRVRIGPAAGGTYTLFARPGNDSGYGKQWVGAKGGTGSQTLAQKITVAAGAVAAGPAVRLDRPGTISGLVTKAATSTAVDSGYVSFSSWHFGAGPENGTGVGRDGRYTLTGLGPYEWPLYFVTAGIAPQWSGGTGNRFKAERIAVKAGATTTYDAALRSGSVLRGTVTSPGGGLDSGRLTAYNSVTADPIAVADFTTDGTYRMLVIGPQDVKIQYEATFEGGATPQGWYDAATSFADADRVGIPGTGEKTLDLTLSRQ